MTHISSFPRRAAAFVLALALLLPLPAVYADAGERILQTSTQIVDGLTYRNTVTVNNNSRVESFSFELSPGSAAQAILLQGDTTVYGGATISRAVSAAQAAGWHVLGAVNTDFFSMATGVPLGVAIENGVFKSSPSGENALTITDGRAAISQTPEVSLSLYDQNTGLTVLPGAFNKYRAEYGGVYLFNSHFSTVSTRSTGSGWYVRMRALPDPVTGQVPELTVNSTLTLEVTELLLSDQALTIGPDEYILTADDKSNRSDAFTAFQLGDQVTFTTSCTDPGLSAAQWACGVGDIMVQDGVLTDSSAWVYANDGRQPRTALGIKPDGTLVLYAVDGRQSGYSIGLSQKDLALELLGQGCTTAVNLDGGGSTALSVWLPGQSGPATQSKPSGGADRSCATYLMLVTDRYGSGVPQRLATASSGQAVLSGSTLTLAQAVAVDEGLDPVSADLSGLTYTSQNRLGTVSGHTYTAGPMAGTDTLLLSAAGLSGSAQIHVVDRLTELTVTRAGSASALSSLSVKPGEQVQLAVSGSYYGRTALWDLAPVTFSVQGDIGTVDQNGLFTASRTPGEGSITLSAGGLSKTVSVVMGNVHDDVQPGHWAYNAVEYCYEHGISSGISSTEFGRDLPISRANFIVMLHNAAGKPAPSGPCTFADVPSTAYYANALAWAQEVGLASGIGDNCFAPLANISREQAFALLYRFLPLIGKTCPDASLTVLDQFSDADQFSRYARVPGATLVSQGLVAGSGGAIAPQGLLTRAQMAVMLYNVLEFTPKTDVPTDPGTTDPGTTDPGTTDPGTTDPGTTDPGTTDPGTSTDPDTPIDPSVNYLLAMNQSQVTLASGGSVTLTASILPAVEGAQLTWTSSDPTAATVSATGMVTNLYPGDGTKTVTVTASWNGLTARCAVTCQPAAHTGTVTNTENGLNVRSGPGTGYDRIGGLGPDAQVVILGQENDWYQVLFRNPDGQAAIGYVLSDYITLNR